MSPARPRLEALDDRITPAGDLDPSFGTGGVATALVGSYSVAHDVAVAPDGKVVVAGTTINGNLASVAVARHNADGTLDPSFGAGGRAQTAVGSLYTDGRAVAVQADGKVVVGGTYTARRVFQSENRGFALVRYNINGTLDTSFGAGGVVRTLFSTATNGQAGIQDLTINPDGRIVAAGGGHGGILLARYNSNGTLDTSFGSGGKVSLNVGSGLAMAARPDGRVVVVGTSETSTLVRGVIAQFTASGQPDATFGADINGNGTPDGYIYPARAYRLTGVALQGDQLVAAGAHDLRPVTTGGRLAVSRYTAAGQSDLTFGADLDGDGTRDGVGYLAPGVYNSAGLLTASSSLDVAVDPTGRLLVGGLARSFQTTNPSAFDTDLAIGRLLADGTPDVSFGVNGTTTIDPSGNRNEEARRVAIQPDGKVLATGGQQINQGQPNQFTTVRLLGDDPPPVPAAGVSVAPPIDDDREDGFALLGVVLG